MASPLTTDELHERLERRVLGPEGQGNRAYLLKEVQIGERRADALSIGLWPSRGIKLEGFELKTNRRDWLREYEDHTKAEPAMQVCDHFWLVANPDVLQPGELPEKWGLLISNGRRRHLKVEKPAPQLQPELEAPISRLLLPTLLRCVGSLNRTEMAEWREQAREEAKQQVANQQASLEHQLEGTRERLRELEAAWQGFCEKAGVDFYDWTRADAEHMELVGEIAQALRAGPRGIKRMAERIRHMETETLGIATKLADAAGKAETAIEGGTA